MKSLHRKMFSIQVKRTDTILAVKEQIKDKEDIPIDQQTIILRENELEDGHTLADCNIQADSTVHLVVLSAQAESVYEPPPPRVCPPPQEQHTHTRILGPHSVQALPISYQTHTSYRACRSPCKT